MRRVISLWLPTFATDRLRRCQQDAPPADTPFVISAHDGHRRVLAAVDAAAAALGLHVGLPLAQAQARIPGLAVAGATPEADAAALQRLAGWCLRYAPLVAPDPPDGIWIDATGATGLAGGEAALLDDLVGRVKDGGYAARAAIADTPGAAHAVARTMCPTSTDWVVSPPPPILGPLCDPSPQEEGRIIVPSSGQGAALAGLPVRGLRLPDEIVAVLHRLGLGRIGQLANAPRAPLTRRFGPMLMRRLDQALGQVFEPIKPVLPPELISRRLAFVEPLATPEAFATVIATLTRSVSRQLQHAGLGAGRLDLLFERVDGSVQAIRVGTVRPAHDPVHLARLLDERLETVDPGLGVEAMRLSVPLTETLRPTQHASLLTEKAAPDLSMLIDRLANRLGAGRVYRVEPVESDVPERSVRLASPLARPGSLCWPAELPRPVRLFSPPRPVRVLAPLPDGAPATFIWRRKRFRVRQADGPERIHGEWWRRDAELFAVRDYFWVEDEAGQRFWLFRRGDGVDAKTGNLDWFVHGVC